MRKHRMGRVVPVVLAGIAIVALLVGSSVLRRESGGSELPPSGVLLPDDAPGARIVEAAGGRELVVLYGPIELPANASHHDVVQAGPHVVPFPADGWVHGYEVEVVDAEDRPVPREVLHHINLIMPEDRELFSNIMRRIGAAGHETGAVRLPRLLGMPVQRGQQLMVTAMMHNPTDQSYERVYVRTRIPFTPRGGVLPRLDVYPFYMDVMPPAGKHAYDLPPGYSEQSWEGRPAVAGRLLGVGGHLHKYGKVLRFEDVTAGKVLWEVVPRLDENGEVIGMPTRRWFWPFGPRLRPDHVYRLTAVYENPTGEVIPEGAMGALGGVIIVGRGGRWPEADQDHPEYVRDVEVTYESAPSDHDHGAHGGHSGDHADHSATGQPDEDHGHHH